MAASRLWVGRSVTSSPSKNTSPSVGASKPARQRNRVVFPQPLPPSKKNNSPRSIAIVTSLHPVKCPSLLRSRVVFYLGIHAHVLNLTLLEAKPSFFMFCCFLVASVMGCLAYMICIQSLSHPQILKTFEGHFSGRTDNY